MWVVPRNLGGPLFIFSSRFVEGRLLRIQMAKPDIYRLQGHAMDPLADLSGSPQLPEVGRWMEAARIAFPMHRHEQEVTAMQQRFINRFQGNRSERHVYLSNIFGRRSTWQTFKDYLRTGGLPEPAPSSTRLAAGSIECGAYFSVHSRYRHQQARVYTPSILSTLENIRSYRH